MLAFLSFLRELFSGTTTPSTTTNSNGDNVVWGS